MSVFEKFIDDIFKNDDFMDLCSINGVVYNCISSGIAGGIVYTDAGEESEVNFTLDIKLPVSKMPKKNDKVIFHEETYKISNVEIDSARTSIKLYLVALSKGI